MIGVYDYTVILTYISMISGVIGIITSMTGLGHPYMGVVFLMISGLLDAFDGKVAGTKKSRTEMEKNFGVQIDSLSDLIAFGVLPAAIGIAQLRRSGIFTELVRRQDYEGNMGVLVLLITIAIFYVLAALIRLAYFNATEEERRKESEKTGAVYYLGVPVTSAALVFPLIMIIHNFVSFDLVMFYFFMLLVTAVAFILNIKVKKPGKLGIAIMILIGIAEMITILLILSNE